MAKNNISPLNQDLFFHKSILTPNITKNRRILDLCVEKMCGNLKTPKNGPLKLSLKSVWLIKCKVTGSLRLRANVELFIR